MELYLYDKNTRAVISRIDGVLSYTGGMVVTESGIYTPLADNVELSASPECTEALRAEWSRNHPTEEARLADLEALMAEVLFGGGDAA